jgi:hypothetical protein
MTLPEGAGAALVIGGGVIILFAVIDPHESSTVFASGVALMLAGIALLWLARRRSVL